MLTETNAERFSIDKFIAGCLSLDWLDIHLRCQNIEVWAESITVSTKDPEYLIKERERVSFIQFIEQFCFIITKKNIAAKPRGMSNANFLKVKPIVEKLVNAGDLKKDWLALYEKQQ
ncbi:MAG TPA: hypothetical protein VK489_12040 [Ferruginibacter sp.]|nr:hypothetical protein [Ferruginibacter sp.]